MSWPRELLSRNGLSPKKSFGQNFLTDPNHARSIAEAATTPPGGTVLEIGAGLGALTRPMLARAARVVAVERDRDLVPVLEGIGHERLRVLAANAAELDFAQAAQAKREMCDAPQLTVFRQQFRRFLPSPEHHRARVVSFTGALPGS